MIKGSAELRKYTTIYPKTVYTINSIEDYTAYGHKLLKQSNNKKLVKHFYNLFLIYFLVYLIYLFLVLFFVYIP